MQKRFVIAGVLCIIGLAVAYHFDTTDLGRINPSIELARQRHSDGTPICDKIVHCGEVVAVSCRPDLDGLLNYYNNQSGELIMQCGGSCLVGIGAAGSKRCEVCPPKEWTCRRIMPN